MNQNTEDYNKIKNYLSRGILKCRVCNKVKKLDKFVKRKDTKFGYLYLCKSCHTARGLLNRQKLANSSPEEFLKYLFRQNKYFAKKRKIKHTLRFDELIEIYEKQKGYCALTNEKMTFKLSTGKIGTNASIDRINSKKIYKKSNVRLVTDLNNRALHTFNDNEVKFYCKKILKNFYKISL